MLPNGGLGRGDQRAREHMADAAPAIKADRSERAYRCGENCARGGITRQDGGRQFRIETANVTGKLWKCQIDR
jgi:hypothetical protein